MILLDSDVLVDILRGYEPAIRWFSALDRLPSVPGLVVMELIQDADNKERMQKALRLVEPLPVVWPTPSDSNRALEDFKIFHLSHGLGLLDALIAACVIGRGGTLCTFNVKHYRVISGLITDQPYDR